MNVGKFSYRNKRHMIKAVGLTYSYMFFQNCAVVFTSRIKICESGPKETLT